MALISKTNRCVVCGSSEVVFDKESGLYRCAACGAESKELMPVSDAAAINRIARLRATEGRWRSFGSAIPDWTLPAGARRTACSSDTRTSIFLFHNEDDPHTTIPTVYQHGRDRFRLAAAAAHTVQKISAESSARFMRRIS